MSNMSSHSVDGAVSARITRLAAAVLDGGEISAAEAHWLFALEPVGILPDLLRWAQRIRERFRGNSIHLCSIVNIKAGGCPEDCRFCAQSAFYQTPSPRHPLVDTPSILRAAAEAQANQVNALGLVAAWPGVAEGPVLDQLCEQFAALRASGLARPDASLGMIRSQRVADRLAAAGVACYNHNLETSERFFPKVCTTHTYADRMQTLRYLRNAGIKICCGGIIGLGETREDRCELALAVRSVGAEFVPLNILNPIPGTPFAQNPSLHPLEILKTIAGFRFVLPRADILIAGGRTVNLRDLQSLIFSAGASALMVGNYLTTLNRPVAEDLQMLADLGLAPRREAMGGDRALPQPPAVGQPPFNRTDE